MPKKGVTKSRISVTIDKDVVSSLNKECKERTMKLSSYIEKLIKIGLKNERNKKGQITLFLILGFVIIIGVGFIYSVSDYTVSERAKSEAGKYANVAFSVDNYKSFLNNCLEEIANEGMIFIGDRGGYFNLPRYNYNDSFIKTAYYFYEYKSYFPKIEILQESISEYIESYVDLCFEELKNLTKFVKINYDLQEINTIITKDSIIINVHIPTKIILNDATHEINNFRIRLDGNRLYDVYNFSEFVINEQVENKYILCLSCIINEATDENLFVDIENIGNNNFIFTVMYNDTKRNSFYEFIFANKYKNISCENLPLDADDTFLMRFIEDCTLEEIEKYNYSLRVKDISPLNVYVGELFKIKINATGLNLTFFDYTELFDIEQKTGIISFTPEEEQIGEHNVLIIVEDGFNNRRFVNFVINISKQENETN